MTALPPWAALWAAPAAAPSSASVDGSATLTAAADSPPLRPTRDGARELLEEELRDSRYDTADGGPIRRLIADALAWLDDRMITLTGVDIPYGPVLLLVLLAVAIVLVLLLVRPRLRHASVEDRALEEEHGITAEELRDRAARRLAAGDPDAAFRDRFRAIVRTAEERDLLPAGAGRTATEAAVGLGAVFTAQRGHLRVAADLFNLSRYGGRPLSARDCEELAALDAALQTSRPDDGAEPFPAVQMVAPR
ncbi:DUF4129 domain-containing protein [Nesterenkonia sp. F]|uniref:DUF4129 domain-containing protein n=1 Tax=Nesterenkonia sp. F TaxID=795955 RepID=UPI00130355B6|nr:DUF4129 domain-containing protein [Nesterenkonia sp. F]